MNVLNPIVNLFLQCEKSFQNFEMLTVTFSNNFKLIQLTLHITINENSNFKTVLIYRYISETIMIHVWKHDSIFACIQRISHIYNNPTEYNTRTRNKMNRDVNGI